jgi:predicted HicB family RNase H-like nuclease
MSRKQNVKYSWGKDLDLNKTVVLDKQGKRLTNARAEKIAHEIVKQATGRPSLTGPKKVSPEVKARVPQKLKIKLEREAKRRGETLSALIREALENYLPV